MKNSGAVIAQLIERLTSNQEVSISNLGGGFRTESRWWRQEGRGIGYFDLVISAQLQLLEKWKYVDI